MSEVQETLNRMQTHKNVQGIVIVNAEGSIIKTTYQNQKKEEGNSLARLVPQLVIKARTTVRDLDTGNDLKFIRLKTTKNQILIAPDNEFILIVVQGQNSESKEEEDA